MGIQELIESDVTSEQICLDRRRILLGAATLVLSGRAGISRAINNDHGEVPPGYEKITDIEVASRHNCYYEFSTDKKAVFHLAKDLSTRPWTITLEGAALKPKIFDIDELLRLFSAEERVYRFRCVEGWSKVVPWMGIPLSKIIKLAEPTANAKYVEFIGASNPEVMIGQRRPVLSWPYTEGLRIDEAVHPLVILAVGMYGKALPNQNGAPLRLVVPWKYGFKSIKAITKIRLVEQQPVSSWTKAAPSEYGFYANVNPAVAHPRWNQRRETRLGEFSKRDTLPFNGYADQVEHLYRGLDLSKHY